MFRKMRRFKQQLSDAEALCILEAGRTGVLAVLGDGGYPYAVPVNYVYADGKLYLHGARTGHKIDAIRRCDKVSFCVVAQDTVVKEELTTYFRSAVAFGRARVLEAEEDICRAAALLGLKYSGDKALVQQEIARERKALGCIEIEIEHLTGKEAIELTRQRARQDS